MGRYIGTSGDDIITSAFVSAGVRADPLGSVPWRESDLLFGDGGKDILESGAGADVIFGGPGDDIVLNGSFGDDIIFGEDGNDSLSGEEGNDFLAGGPGFDRLDGGFNNDTLDGGDSFDFLLGGPGSDTLIGGSGNDTLNGEGGGNDRYDFNSTSDSPSGAILIGFKGDIIQRFDFGDSIIGSKIDLSTIDANETLSGNQAFQYIDTAAFSAPGQVRVDQSFNPLNGQVTDLTVVQLNTDSDLFAESEIRVMDGARTPEFWDSLDFVL